MKAFIKLECIKYKHRHTHRKTDRQTDTDPRLGLLARDPVRAKKVVKTP